ncbi:alpha/beta hydrolase [Curtobacterium sp. NPDC098951]|uniref:alpha/beta hydrolase n=1 Tax=Curtobacterium sp. NPDC098951 TaxID=3363974 RepID=UPI00382F6228
MTADPTAGDPDGIRRLARLHTEHADAVRAGARHVVDAAAAAQSGWTGRAQERFVSVAATVPASAQRIAARLDEAASALDTYAIEVQRIQDEAHRVQTAQQAAADDVAANARAIRSATEAAESAEVVESDTTKLHQLQNGAASLAGLQGRLSAQWDELVTRREAADRQVASALEAPEVVGKLQSAAAVAKMGDGQFLTWLGSLDKESIAALQDDPTIAARLARVDAKDVALWWNAMSGLDGAHSAEQDAFVAAIPAALGNLNGVAYWARARANSTVLADKLSEAKQKTSYWEKQLKSASSPAAAAAARAQLQTWQRQRDGYQNIQNTLKTKAVSLISLVDDRPPLAQIVVGDMDTAAHVTYVVPGMNTATYQDGTVSNYATIADGMRSRQAAVGGVVPTDVAVVSWIGYHGPMADDLSFASVVANGRARTGADALAADLNGFDAVRAASGRGADLSVVAHSYGTNVATIALTKTHADHVVLLGSAGVTDVAPNAEALQVPKGEVFASQGAKDGWAITGQNLSGRQDPTDPSWGAHDFSSETQGSGADELHGVTHHGPYDGREGNDHGRYSYFDNNTTSQYYTAKATMGLGDEIPEAGAPFDRMRQQTEDNWFMYQWQTGLTGDPTL